MVKQGILWTVAIPVYNPDEGYLRQVLESVVANCPKEKGREIILLDDGSEHTHYLNHIDQAFGKEIRILKNTSNSGLAVTWNRCITEARGEYIHIIHQDDDVLPGYYEAMEVGLQHDEVGAAFCRTIFMDKKGLWRSFSKLVRMSPGVVENCFEELSSSVFIQCPTISVKKSTYETIGLFNENLVFALDWEMWLRIALRKKIWFEPQAKICWRNSGESETHRLLEHAEQVNDIKRMKEYFLARNDIPNRESFIKKMDKKIVRTGIAAASQLLNKKNKKAAITNLSAISPYQKEPSDRLAYYKLKVALAFT